MNLNPKRKYPKPKPLHVVDDDAEGLISEDTRPEVEEFEILEFIIRNSIFAADCAVLNANRQGKIFVPADRTRIAVTAAIRNAVANGGLKVAPIEEISEFWSIEKGTELDD